MGTALFERTHVIHWAERWYDWKKKSADMSKDTDPRHSLHAYSFAGNAAQAMFGATREISWAEKWFESYRVSAEMAKDVDQRHSAYACSLAGNAARALSESVNTANKKFYWARRWYQNKCLSANGLQDIEPKDAAQAYSFAGRAAREMYKLSGSKRWATDAIACYKKFLDYYDHHQDDKMQGLISDVKRNVRILRESVDGR